MNYRAKSDSRDEKDTATTRWRSPYYLAYLEPAFLDGNNIAATWIVCQINLGEFTDDAVPAHVHLTWERRRKKTDVNIFMWTTGRSVSWRQGTGCSKRTCQLLPSNDEGLQQALTMTHYLPWNTRNCTRILLGTTWDAYTCKNCRLI